MKPEDFDLLAVLLKQRSGLVLTRDKAYLLESRLLPVARKWSLKSLEELAQHIRTKRDEAMLREVTEAMTTNESFFFRDQKPFDKFRNVMLPALLKARSGRNHIRIWSAAASSGQEAYSLAMICAEEAAKLNGWKVEIIGTDLSSEMVEKSKAGIYSQFEVQRGLPITLLVKYFQQLGGDRWQIREDIRRMVQFREGNLLNDFGPIGTFDIIYCRNVLIYFDQPTKSKVLDAMSAIMNPDGYLLLGGAETILGLTNRFKPMENEQGLYILSGSTAADQLRPRTA